MMVIKNCQIIQYNTIQIVYSAISNIHYFKPMNRGLTGGFLLLWNFSVAISVSPHVCFILVLILISVFLR